jgi:hypothetical protein
VLAVGLIMGTRLWYRMWDAETDDGAAFKERVDAVCNEIGQRGQPAVAEAVPPPSTMRSKTSPMVTLAPAPVASAPAPVPAHDSATALGPSPVASLGAPARLEASTSAQVAPSAGEPTSNLSTTMNSAPNSVSSALQLGGLPMTATSVATLAEVAAVHKEQRDHLEARMDQMEARFESKVVALEQHRDDLQARLAAYQQPQPAITEDELIALQARLDRLHEAKLLSKEELYALEDCLSDFFEASAGCDVITMMMVGLSAKIGNVHKMLAISRGAAKDEMFARQMKRKFC